MEIVGTVRDKDTGKPLAGITVQTTAPFGNPGRYLMTTTDVQGGYRFAGVPPKTDYGVEQDVLAAPKDGPPYVPTVQHVGAGMGLARPVRTSR
jgi:Carboxypeptidase regulatory-like domain